MGDPIVAGRADRMLLSLQERREGQSMAVAANGMNDPSRRPEVEMETPLVYISILNWNGYEQTAACLSSLFGMDYPNYKIVIVDNGSSDGSVDHLAKRVAEHPDRITLLTNAYNAGFTGGHNLAMNFAVAAGADYVWLVNNDLTVLPKVLTMLVAAASEAADIGLVSPVMYYTTQPDRIWNCGALLDVEDGCSNPTQDIATARKWQETEPRKFIVWGAALLIRRSLIDRIGLLDDRFFAYCEDIDYSIRSVGAGFRNVLAEGAVVYHDKSLTWSDDLVRPYFHYFDLRNNFMLMSKHSRRWRGLKGKLWYTRRVLRRLEQPEGSAAAVREAILLALWDIWRGVGGHFDPRRRMPWPLRPMLDARPGFWRRLLEVI